MARKIVPVLQKSLSHATVLPTDVSCQYGKRARTHIQILCRQSCGKIELLIWFYHEKTYTPYTCTYICPVRLGFFIFYFFLFYITFSRIIYCNTVIVWTILQKKKKLQRLAPNNKIARQYSSQDSDRSGKIFHFSLVTRSMTLPLPSPCCAGVLHNVN